MNADAADQVGPLLADVMVEAFRDVLPNGRLNSWLFLVLGQPGLRQSWMVRRGRRSCGKRDYSGRHPLPLWTAAGKQQALRLKPLRAATPALT